MNQKQHAPGAQGKHAGAFYNNEFRVFSLLVCGGQWATFDIAERLNIPDPRSTIRYIRKMGNDVADVWVHENKMRFKRYYIHGGDAVC